MPFAPPHRRPAVPVRPCPLLLARHLPRDPLEISGNTLPPSSHRTFLQHDLYELVIITKGKPVAISQWIYWSYMENKHNLIFDIVVATCRAKHLRDVMAFRKNWKNKVIAQFFATLFIEEHGDTSKLH
jgi:hypothetical protein